MISEKENESPTGGILRWYGISVFLPGAVLLVVVVVLLSFEVEKDTIYWVVAPAVLLISYINGRGLRSRLTPRK